MQKSIEKIIYTLTQMTQVCSVLTFLINFELNINQKRT